MIGQDRFNILYQKAATTIIRYYYVYMLNIYSIFQNQGKNCP